MAHLENIEAIERRLWSAADQLRANSNHASNEYFLPVNEDPGFSQRRLRAVLRRPPAAGGGTSHGWEVAQ